jgi:molybdate transport system substrate-binding protein
MENTIFHIRVCAFSPSVRAQSKQALAPVGAIRNSRAMMSLRPLIFALCTSATLAAPIGAEPVTIFAASSLKTALDNVIETRALDAVPVYGGSAAIARQIAQGAEADIVILAHPDWMEWLSTQEVLQNLSRCNLLSNALVLAASANAPDLDVQSANDLITALNGERLSVGQLRAVPAGQYTRTYLSEQGWLDALRPHLAETSNVRLALALIARGEVPLGFVYASDVAAEPRVRAVFTPDAMAYPAIRYPMAITTNAREGSVDIAKALIAAQQVFAEQGFANVPTQETGRCE